MSKKLIEVSLPLDVINDASAYDKMPGIGAHPKGIHQWWARLPLPTARAILFASLIEDPSSNLDKFPTEKEQETERERLFGIIRKLTEKKIHTKQDVFQEAHREIIKHCDGKLPMLLDPFAGGGSIPLEGMRLGLPVQATDLNPVAVLVNKAQIEILPKFAEQQPLNPETKNSLKLNKSALGAGLAVDLKFYGNLINDQAKKQFGSFYPKAKIGSKDHTVVSWLWARTMRCPNPACGSEMPLVRSFIISTKKKPNFFVNPIIKKDISGKNEITFEVMQGIPKLKGTISRAEAICICCNQPVKLKDVREYGKKNGYGERLIGMVVEGGRGKTYISPTDEQASIAFSSPKIKNYLDAKLPANPRWFSPPLYGLDEYDMLFSQRQLFGLSTLQTLIEKNRTKIVSDGGTEEYANAITLFLYFALDRCTDFNNSLSRWNSSNEKVMNMFGRQAIPMVWDFGEANLLGNAVGSWLTCSSYVSDCCAVILTDISKTQKATQINAAKFPFDSKQYIISTDPPYYDNIGYSDLSDFFYIWLRKGLKKFFPELLSTLLVPKMEELVASDVRYGGKEAAKGHFENGFREAFANFKNGIDPRFPLTVYYAFKQDEDDDSESFDNSSKKSIGLTTGWETLLEGLVLSGFQITATWPIKASQKWRMVAMGTNALTSYIVLACRPRPDAATSITRREYLQILKRELPDAIKVLQHSNLAPVDMAQATIGPGMSIYSRYNTILEQDGAAMTVRTALSLINNSLDEILAEQEGDFDAETRWAISWFEQNGFENGAFGEADALARAKNTAVNALVNAKIVNSSGGSARLISRIELNDKWDPISDDRVVIWEMTQHLIKQLQETGEIGAARLFKRLGVKADVSRELAYRLFLICEKKGWSQEAQAYNSLVLSWSLIVSESFNIRDTSPQQGTLFE